MQAMRTKTKPVGYKAGRTTTKRVRAKGKRVALAKHRMLDELLDDALAKDK